MGDTKEIKQILITLDYPGIKSIKTDEDVLRIISPENRKVFLKWVFDKSEPGVFTCLDEETISTRLSELVECNGLCSNQETSKFINGNMDYEAQLKIIERILNFLVTSWLPGTPNEKKNSDLPDRNKSCFQDFDSLIKQIDEMFPNLESISQDVTKMDQILKNEKNVLLKELEKLEKNGLVDLDFKEIKEPNLEELKNNLNNFQIKNEWNKITNKPVIIDLETETIKVPLGIKDELNKFVEMQENVDVICNFNENISSIRIDDKPINEKVQELLSISKEIV